MSLFLSLLHNDIFPKVHVIYSKRYMHEIHEAVMILWTVGTCIRR